MLLSNLNTNTTNSSYWWLVTSSWIQKSTLKSKIAPSLKRMIIDHLDKSQVMGKPANALLIDCRSMEGRFVNQSTFFRHRRSCHFCLVAYILPYFHINHLIVIFVIFCYESYLCSDWSHCLIPECLCWSQTQTSSTNLLAVSIRCLIQCDRYEQGASKNFI